MSLALKTARLEAMGDPGLFGSIFKGIGKVVGGAAKIAGNILPGPLGGVAKITGQLLGGGGPPATVSRPVDPTVQLRKLQEGRQLTKGDLIVLQRAGVSPQQIAQAQTRTRLRIGGGGISLGGPGGVGVSFPTSQFEFQTNGGGRPQPQMIEGQAGAQCPKGFHLNKTSYFLKDGTFVPARSRCVRNRRRDPLNARANRRAISRLKMAKRHVKQLGQVRIHDRKCK